MRTLRSVHRGVTLFIVIFTLYLGTTGTLIQWVDLRSLFTHKPATDPNVQAMREGFSGPGGFQVITSADYTAPRLGPTLNIGSLLSRVYAAARSRVGGAPLQFVELRVEDGKPVGQVDTRTGNLLRFDAMTGAYLGDFPEVHESQTPVSERNTLKHLHRMTSFGNWALWINVFVGTGLAVLIVTGAWMYWNMWSVRAKQKLTNPFWTTGGWWRRTHRLISALAAVFLAIVMLSGTWLAFESLWFGYHLRQQFGGQRPGTPIGEPHNGAPSVSRAGGPGSPLGTNLSEGPPLRDADVESMLQVTLQAYQGLRPGIPARVIRLRNYSNMEQGVVISGDSEAKQLVFNARTGKKVTASEPGFPPSAFPFGWEAHQVAKSVHRGDFFGMTGRIMDFFAGLSMVYLSISGIAMYYRLWANRRRAGRRSVLWA